MQLNRGSLSLSLSALAAAMMMWTPAAAQDYSCAPSVSVLTSGEDL